MLQLLKMKASRKKKSGQNKISNDRPANTELTFTRNHLSSSQLTTTNLKCQVITNRVQTQTGRLLNQSRWQIENSHSQRVNYAKSRTTSISRRKTTKMTRKRLRVAVMSLSWVTICRTLKGIRGRWYRSWRSVAWSFRWWRGLYGCRELMRLYALVKTPSWDSTGGLPPAFKTMRVLRFLKKAMN